ncbi:MAG: sulfatase [Halobacteriales archaeon]
MSRLDIDVENVLLVSIDCLRADRFREAVRGGMVPSLARLQESGTVFETAVTVANTTDPSCTSLLTGTYPHTHGVQENGWGLEESVPVVGEALGAAGVDTFGVVSVDHLADEHSGLGRGFDAFQDGGSSYDTLYPFLSRIYDTRTFNRVFGAVKDLGTERYNLKTLLRETGLIQLHARTAASVTEDAIEELDRVEQPFFGWAHYFDMHEPRNYDRRDLGEHEEYGAAMKLVDDHVGSLLDALEARGLRESTLIVLTADHGEALDDHGYTGHGRQLYDEEVRVPLVFAHSDAESATVADQVRTIDLAPTVLDLLGADVPDAFEGVSLLTAPEESGGPSEKPDERDRGDPAVPGNREAFLTAYPEFTESVGLRVPGWKLIREGEEHELYDLEADPGERRDLVAAGDTDDTPYGALRERLAAWEQEGDVTEQAVDEETREMLADLGYVDTGRQKS